jgi:acetolactate synthase-1/2/3 large subunit
MAPLTKMARQIVSAATIPSIVREAFRLAQQERLGPVHLELPERLTDKANRKKAGDFGPVT